MVNTWPLVITVLSGTVTSSIMAALSWHAPLAAAVEPVAGVEVVSAPGVLVIDGSGVEVSAVSVGSTSATRVGGSVEVTNEGGTLVEDCGTRFAQADSINPASRM